MGHGLVLLDLDGHADQVWTRNDTYLQDNEGSQVTGAQSRKKKKCGPHQISTTCV